MKEIVQKFPDNVPVKIIANKYGHSGFDWIIGKDGIVSGFEGGVYAVDLEDGSYLEMYEDELDFR